MSAPTGQLPMGYMWIIGRIHEAGGRMLTATESRILLHAGNAANPNHLRRGSVGVQKAARLWGAAGIGAAGAGNPSGLSGSVAPTTQPVAPSSAPRAAVQEEIA